MALSEVIELTREAPDRLVQRCIHVVWRVAREEPVARRAQTIDVAAGGHALPFPPRLFGGHVRRAADRGAILRQRLRRAAAEECCDAEIDQHGLAVAVVK